VTDKKFLLLKMHPCVGGLSDEAVQEIADAAELLYFNSGDVVHRPNEVVTSVNLVIHGRLRLSLMDLHGDVSLRMYEHAGGQYGGLTAALSGSAPIECIAEDPTTILRLDFQTGLGLSKKHELFRLNMLRSMADSVRQTLLKNKDPVKPRLVAIYHQSPETRDLSRQLIIRLNELGESTCVLTDCQNWVPIQGVPDRKLYTNSGVEIDLDEVRRQIHAWTDSQRIFIDVETSDVTGHPRENPRRPMSTSPLIQVCCVSQGGSDLQVRISTDPCPLHPSAIDAFWSTPHLQ
jgi:CRP-like cAMP-binding protein